MPVAIAKMFGSKMMSSGGKPISLGQQLVGARADLDLALDGVGLAVLVEGHHHHGGAVAAHQPRLAQELGFAFLHRDRVDDALALQALQAGLDHAPLRASRPSPARARCRARRRSGCRKRDHRLLGVEHALVHVDVDDLRAALDLLARDDDALRRSGPSRISFLNCAEPVTLVRSPTLTKLLSGVICSGSRPLRRVWRGRLVMRRPPVAARAAAAHRATAAAIARMCAGVVPQQPPTMLSRPACGELAQHRRPCPPGVSS